MMSFAVICVAFRVHLVGGQTTYDPDGHVDEDDLEDELDEDDEDEDAEEALVMKRPAPGMLMIFYYCRFLCLLAGVCVFESMCVCIYVCL